MADIFDFIEKHSKAIFLVWAVVAIAWVAFLVWAIVSIVHALQH